MSADRSSASPPTGASSGRRRTTDRLSVEPEIRRAETLPAAFYADRDLFERARERIFVPSWQFAGDSDPVRSPGQVRPLDLLPGLLDEPLLLARDRDDELRCLSNVCTHRGNLLVEAAGSCQVLRCRYHGRRFDLDGRLRSMPGFDGAEGFPRPEDDLPRLPLAAWGKLLFTSLAPAVPFDEWIGPLAERLAWFPADRLAHEPTRSRDYLVRAHWALYMENYLEGFHIPYVHPGLADVLDQAAYGTEIHRWSNLQLGVATGAEDAFEPPPDSPDHGTRVAAYYYWLFPNTMLNVYPWGVSVNVVQPLALDRTKVSFLTYVGDPDRLDQGAGAALDRVEREDEAVVETVQRGVRSRLYHRGRFSPAHERGVHQFHRLLAQALDD